MANLNWIYAAENLSQAAMTVRAQTISPNDDGALIWDRIFPRKDVPSVKVADIETLNYRPAADRREWNARGRRIPMVTPRQRVIEIIPIEANGMIDEKEQQKLMERSMNNEQIFRDLIGADVPARVDGYTNAVYRRLELDMFEAWLKGTITQKNPENGQTVALSYGIDAARLTTAGTAWNDSGVNAYREFIAWAEDAQDAIGSFEGAMMRRLTRSTILADAPSLVGGAEMSLGQLEDRISQDLGSAFNFIINERTIDVFTDGGVATTQTKEFSTGYVAAIPAGGIVGYSAFAPVVRAAEVASEAPGAGIDTNGVTVYYESINGGRSLEIDVQANAMPIPDEGRVFVVNAGV